jgi:hypothetical protein
MFLYGKSVGHYLLQTTAFSGRFLFLISLGWIPNALNFADITSKFSTVVRL